MFSKSWKYIFGKKENDDFMDEEYNVPPKDIEPMFHQKTLSNVPPEDIEEGITIHSSKVKESFAYGALLEHQKVDEL